MVRVGKKNTNKIKVNEEVLALALQLLVIHIFWSCFPHIPSLCFFAGLLLLVDIVFGERGFHPHMPLSAAVVLRVATRLYTIQSNGGGNICGKISTHMWV